MAEGCLKAIVNRENLSELVEVRSAGTAGIEGMPPTPTAVEVCRERGIDISGHSSKGLTADEIASSDMILVMTRQHARAIEHTLPGGSSNVYLLGAADIPDPIGGTLQQYRDTLDRIEESLEKKWLPIIKSSVEGARR
jgi:protein-tyrosine-phosphatase